MKHRRTHLQYLAWILPLCAVLFAAGCDRDDAVHTYKAPHETQTPADASDDPSAAAPSNAMAGAMPADLPTLTWDLPTGWNDLGPADVARGAITMHEFGRVSLKPGDDQNLVVVTASNPRPLAEQVQRWENMINGPALTLPDVDKIARRITVDNVPVDLVTLPPPGVSLPIIARIAVFNLSDVDYFVKYQGDPAAFNPDLFLQLVQSIRFTKNDAPVASASPGPSPSSDPSPQPATDPDPLPPGWRTETEQPIQLLYAGPGDNPVQINVSCTLARDAFSKAQLVQRCRAAIGLDPDPDPDKTTTAPLKLGSTPGAYAIDFLSPTTAPSTQKRIVFVVIPEKDVVYYVKMLGPASVVAEETPNLTQFLKSFAAQMDNK